MFGTPMEVITVVIRALIGVILLAADLQGYLLEARRPSPRS
ncbi:hypothetical protein [Aquisalimonas sp.]|nr:hypothetical protein [Aquisalimonas sp.]